MVYSTTPSTVIFAHIKVSSFDVTLIHVEKSLPQCLSYGNIKKIFIKVFTSDGSAKSLLVDEKMSVSHVTRILAEKNHVKLGKQPKCYDIIKNSFSLKNQICMFI